MCSSPNVPFARFPWSSRERRPWQHSVLTGNPAFPAVAKESRYRFFDRCRADYPRMSNLNERRSLSHSDVIRGNFYRTHLLRGAIVTAERRHEEVYLTMRLGENRVIG